MCHGGVDISVAKYDPNMKAVVWMGGLDILLGKVACHAIADHVVHNPF